MSSQVKRTFPLMSGPPLGKKKIVNVIILKSALAERRKIFAAAGIQLLICTLFPGRWAVVPIAILILSMIIARLIDLLTPSTEPPPSFTKHIVRGRTTTVMPESDGSLPAPGKSTQSIVVFNLGVQLNHPLGLMSPYGREMQQRFLDLNDQLMERREEFGLLHMSQWQPVGDNTGFNSSYYFKNVEGIHKFAHEEAHRALWDFYTSLNQHHIGVYHETFIVPPNMHETIYLNCKPVLFGAAIVKCNDVEGDDKWVNTLVSADSPKLKSQWERLDRDVNGTCRTKCQ